MELELTTAQQNFVEQFALAWEEVGYGRMEGRVMGLFMIIDRAYLASSELSRLLGASTGAVSMATRNLIKAGFLHRHVIPGDRQHYFATEDDVWGGFLRSERAYLRRLEAVIATGQDLIDPEAGAPRRRLANAQNYITWLEQQHTRLLAEWNAYRDEHYPENRDV